VDATRNGDAAAGGVRANAPREVPERRAAAGTTICVIGLTKLGKKFMGNLLPNHSKLVKALLRVLHAREQESLVRICEKLREGDVLKFVTELRWVNAEE
jgi:hypothetical protein